MNILEKYVDVEELYSDDKYSKHLVKELETSNLYVKHIVKNADSKIYKQLLNNEHLNIIQIFHISEANNELILIEEYFDGITLRQCFNEGVKASEFEDILLQINDALEFLNKQSPAISYNALSLDNILVGEDNLLKLTNFRDATNGDISNDLMMFGEIIQKSEVKYANRYEKVIERCNGTYTTTQELRKDLLFYTRSYLGLPYGIGIGIMATALIVFRLLRILKKAL